MTKREIMKRYEGIIIYPIDGPNRIDWPAYNRLHNDLADDARFEEMIQRAEDDEPETVATFADARRRVQAIRDWVSVAKLPEAVLAAMLRVLCADLTDAHKDDTTDRQPDPCRLGPYSWVDLRTIQLTLPPGEWTVTGTVKPSKRE